MDRPGHLHVFPVPSIAFYGMMPVWLLHRRPRWHDWFLRLRAAESGASFDQTTFHELHQ
jgi:hypothetical protein